MSWFAKGLRFECTGCGRCCTQGPGYVWVTDEEIGAIARRLGMPLARFRAQYVMDVGGSSSLVERPGDFRCVFLGEGERCTIYDIRPLQCRTFPFWPENLANRPGWEELREYCEGIDRGPQWSASQIRRIRDLHIEV